MTREEFIKKYSSAHYGDVKSLEKKLADIAGLIYDVFGESTLADLNTDVFGENDLTDLTTTAKDDLISAINEVNATAKTLSLKPKVGATAAAIAALSSPVNGDTYRVITTGGNLNSAGNAITTLVGDVVFYNATTSLWEFLVSGAAINV